MIIRPVEALGETAMITLQYALKRGIESVFQLAESELMVEPLPDKEHRNAILFYEASEGGAGVLTRIAHDPDALAQVAKRALQISHYEAGDPCGVDTLQEMTNIDGTPICEAGCYKCLLSYYNQPDHDKIDRKDPEVLRLLCALANAQTEREPTPIEEAESSDLGPQQRQLEQTLLALKLPLPDSWGETVAGVSVDGLYTSMQIAVIVAENFDEQIVATLEDRGFIVIVLDGANPSAWHEVLEENRELLTGGVQ